MVPILWNWTDILQNNQIGDSEFHFQRKEKASKQARKKNGAISTNSQRFQKKIKNVILFFKNQLNSNW